MELGEDAWEGINNTACCYITWNCQSALSVWPLACLSLIGGEYKPHSTPGISKRRRLDTQKGAKRDPQGRWAGLLWECLTNKRSVCLSWTELQLAWCSIPFGPLLQIFAVMRQEPRKINKLIWHKFHVFLVL